MEAPAPAVTPVRTIRTKAGVTRAVVPKVTDKLNDKLVLSLRRRYLDQKRPILLGDLARLHGITTDNLRRALTGKTYPHVKRKISAKKMEAIRRARRPFSPEVVLFMRIAYKPGVVDIPRLASAYGISKTQMQAIVNGRIYQDVPWSLKGDLAPSRQRRGLSDAQVMEARRRFSAFEVTIPKLGEELNLEDTAVNAMLRGFTYKDVPGAVSVDVRTPYEFTNRERVSRKLTDETALFIRIIYDSHKVSVPKLAAAYGCHHNAIYRLIQGKAYKHLPYECSIRRYQTSRLLSDEQVVQARAWVYRGQKSIAQIATLFGVSESTIDEAVKGITYADIPGAVPLTIRGIQRALSKRPLIQPQPVFCPDHNALLHLRYVPPAE